MYQLQKLTVTDGPVFWENGTSKGIRFFYQTTLRKNTGEVLPVETSSHNDLLFSGCGLSWLTFMVQQYLKKPL